MINRVCSVVGLNIIKAIKVLNIQNKLMIIIAFSKFINSIFISLLIFLILSIFNNYMNIKLTKPTIKPIKKENNPPLFIFLNPIIYNPPLILINIRRKKNM